MKEARSWLEQIGADRRQIVSLSGAFNVSLVMCNHKKTAKVVGSPTARSTLDECCADFLEACRKECLDTTTAPWAHKVGEKEEPKEATKKNRVVAHQVRFGWGGGI